MKKILLLSFMAMSAMTASAQDVDAFDVGPYEVEYAGEGDYKFRLRKGVDLYDYYGLKRDTVFKVSNEPVSDAISLEGRFRIPRYIAGGVSNVFEVSGSWKHAFSKGIYFNAGLSAAISVGYYNDGIDETFFELGLPLSVEFANIDRRKASLYATFGITPAWYSGVKDVLVVFNDKTKTKEMLNGDGKSIEGENLDEKSSGMLITPQIGFGGYFPVGRRLLRLGGFVQYDNNCTKDDYDIFEKRIGRFSVGANIGLVF